MSHPHTSHASLRNRLRRLTGHLESIQAMFEAGRTCTDLAQQLSAVEKAVKRVKEELIQDHIEHCLHDKVRANPKAAETLAEVRRLVRFL